MSDLASGLALEATGPAPYIAGGLAVSGVAVAWSRRRELIRRWLTWAVTAPLVGGAFLLGRPGVTVLAAALAVGCALEYARLVRMPALDRAVLLAGLIGILGVAAVEPAGLGRAAYAVPLIAVLPAVLEGDARQGGRRAASLAFGLLWIGALAGLVILGHRAFAVIVAVSVGDVAAWCAGKACRGPRLSPLSPGKRVSGAIGAALVGSAVLWAFGALSPALMIAVALGAPMGDLVESMLKREAGAKDAGSWLPGFGGLLDRVDSLLLALLLALVLS